MMERLNIFSDFDAFEYYFERFEIWAMTKEHDEDVNIAAHFLTLIGKEAHGLLKTLALPEKPISPSYTTLKELLLDYVKYTIFECGKGGRFHKMIHEDIKNSTTLSRHPNPVHTQGYADNNSLRSCDEVHEDGHKLSIYNDHLSSSTIAIDSVESHSSSELNETQNPCKTTVSNLYGFFTNDSHISDEIPCKCEENMLSEPNHDRKPDGVLIDADFANDPLLCNDILNKFDENHFGNYQILMSYQILFVLIMHLLLVGNVLSEKHRY
ncbi:unnamed protein product [Schistosoma curassoni]|uniref:RGS domain-containing protein n=1 Tax=Schistosoma curassoni TaxID=6186 RepID=A0A183JVL8_9TREM|nr:unnamed protein product [Schistosoma curassoni]